MRYLLFEIKRSFRKTGYLILTIILLALICGGVFRAVSSSSEQKPTAAPFTIVVTLPENAGPHYNLALGMVSAMDSFRSMCNVVTTKSEESARAMLENGEAKAAVLIPEGLIHSVLNGGNLPASIIYPSKPSIETVLFRNLIDALAHMLAASQSGVYALYDIYSQYNMTEDVQSRANSELNSNYINLVLSRSSFFLTQNLSVNSASSPIFHFISGGLTLLFLLGGICLCDCLCPLTPVLSQSLSRLRINRFFACLAPVFGAFLTQFCLYSLIFFCVRLIPPLQNILPNLSCHFLVVLAVTLFFTAAFQLFVCRLFRFREAAVIGLFVISFFTVFLSGCLLPAAFLPSVIRQIIPFNPVFYLQQALSAGLSGIVSISSLVILLSSGLLLIFLSVGIEAFACKVSFRSFTQRKNIPIRQTAIHSSFTAASSNHALFHAVRHACSWGIFLGKRTARHPIYWILAGFIFLTGIASQFTKPEEAFISVGIYCEQPDAFTAAVINRLLNQPSDRLYQFHLADSTEELKEDVLWGRTECGYIIPNSLSTYLNKERESSINVLTGPSSILTELIHEEVCAAIFEEWAPIILSDYLKEAQDITLSDDEYSVTSNEYYHEWRQHGNTFRVEYDDVDEAFFSNQTAFSLPLRGMLSLLLFTAVMAGMAQYRHDRARQLFLARHAAERHYLPIFYSLFPAVLPALSGLICLYLTGQNQPFYYELSILLAYLASLILFALFANFLIQNSLLFDAAIPVFIIFCILYAPVITDLSEFLPAGKILSQLAPANWYLSYF